MATTDEIYAAIRNADKAGDSESVRKLGAYLQTMPNDDAKQGRVLAQQAQDRETYNPTNGMSGVEKFVAGYGKAIPDMVRGIGQRIGSVLPDSAVSALGLPTQADIDEHKRLDAPLMKTGAGMAGNIGGNIAAALPSVAIPGAASIPGAAVIGGTMGLIQPTATGESALKNAAVGAGLGAGSVVAGQLVGAGYRGAKAIAEPFTKDGPQRIAGRTLLRFAEDPARIAGGSNQPTITGALPTLAEQTGDTGLARLQDSLRSVDPQINNALAARFADNNAARVNSLQSLAGDSTTMKAAVSARSAATKPAYDNAFAQTVEVTPELERLLARPSVQQAMGRATNIAKEEGRSFGLTPATEGTPGQSLLDASGKAIASLGGTSGTPARVTGQTLQDLKMGLDALLKDPTSGIAGKEALNVKATRNSLVSLMEQAIPDFNAARTGYAAASKPINGMQTGEEIARRATSNTSDMAGNPRMQANALLGMLRDEPGLIQRATGRKGINSLSDVFDPTQLNLLRNVASETDRAAAVATAGNGPGSATAQRLASQNILRQVITPNGASASPSFGQKVGQAVVDNTLANTVVGKATNWIYSGIAEPKIQASLLKAVLSPEEAQLAIQAAQQKGITLPNNLLTRLMGQARRVTGFSASQATGQP